jgi:hypothetical protein
MVISWDKAQNSGDMSPAAPETIQDAIPPGEQPPADVPGRQDQPGQAPRRCLRTARSGGALLPR